MSHFFFFLPPLHLTTDNKNIFTWAGLKSGTYFWQSILTFPFTCRLCSSLKMSHSWLKSQAKKISVFCCIALAWARLLTWWSSRGQNPDQKQGRPAPALPALPAAARESPQTHLQGQSSSVTLSCAPCIEGRQGEPRAPTCQPWFKGRHVPQSTLKQSGFAVAMDWNQLRIAFLSMACIVAVRHSSLSTPHHIRAGSSPERV